LETTVVSSGVSGWPLNTVVRICLAIILILSGCAVWKSARGEAVPEATGHESRMRVAVFPVDNMSGAFVPVRDLRLAWIEKLKEIGLDVIDDEILESTLERHRFRYIGGVDSEAARAFKEEAGADAVLITSLEYSNEYYPPKIALVSRLTSTGDNPRILWIESVGMAGDDSPGILGLGLVPDLATLQQMALKRLADSLARAVRTNIMPHGNLGYESKYRPKQFYNASQLNAEKKVTIAVVPFYNNSMRRRAGDLLQAHFTRQLALQPGVVPIEPGIIREKMLGIRMIMPQGVSIRDVDVLTYILDADFVLSGSVFDYQDPRGGAGTPKLDFSSLMINRAERKVVMLAKSYNQGDDGVYFFDIGRENNASVMAEKMSGSIVDMMEEIEKAQVRLRSFPERVAPRIMGLQPAQ
jgi:hypothetical protein